MIDWSMEGTKIPPFKKITKGALIALDIAELLETIGIIPYMPAGSTALKMLVIRYVGGNYVFGYEETPFGKDYFHRTITKTVHRRYFKYGGKDVPIPEHLNDII